MTDKIVKLLLAVLLIIGLSAISALGYFWHTNHPKPTQPIDFDHSVHVVNLELKCVECHSYADVSPTAGLPSMKKCMDCHSSAVTDRPEIKKLTEYWNNKERIPWIKVHAQPWHVHFTHKRHVKAGIDCTVCHGEVKVMDTARRVRSLEMGWCVNCHRQNDAPTDCLVCHK